MRVLATAVIVILALLSTLLGWQVYSMRQSASGQTGALSQKDAELTQLRQTLSERDAELARLRQTVAEKDAELFEVSKTRTWSVLTERGVSIAAIRLSEQPRADKVLLRITASIRFPLLSGPGPKVLATAPNWGADQKVVTVSGGALNLQYEFPAAVTEATISLAP